MEPWYPGRDSNPQASSATGFKPAASTDFATRASLVPMRESPHGDSSGGAIVGCNARARATNCCIGKSSQTRSAVTRRFAKFRTAAKEGGGAGRSRTDLLGFAIRCITALLPRHRRDRRTEISGNVDLMRAGGMLSSAHTEADIDATIAAAHVVLSELPVARV